MTNATTEGPLVGMATESPTPNLHPAVTGDLYTTVFRANIDGRLVTKWYDGMECRTSDLLRTTEHHAFLYKEHMEYTTCDQAKAGLLAVMGPVHGVDWGCYYSESQKGWFRPECTVTPHPYKSVAEATKNIWGTPGGVFLILFIIALSIFSLWWAFKCYRAKKCDWWWRINGKAKYAAQYSATDRNDDEDDDVNIYTINGEN
tara:strand:- start:61 stop:666 length:606 start_codon:yes stop_codon:yes gene_type:complete